MYKVFSYLVRSGNATKMVYSSAAPMELVWMSDKEWCLSRHRDHNGTHALEPASTPAAQCSHATGHKDTYENNNEGVFFL